MRPRVIVRLTMYHYNVLAVDPAASQVEQVAWHRALKLADAMS